MGLKKYGNGKRKNCEERNQKREYLEPVAKGKEMVIGTLALLSGLFMLAFEASRASAPKGDEVL